MTLSVLPTHVLVTTPTPPHPPSHPHQGAFHVNPTPTTSIGLEKSTQSRGLSNLKFETKLAQFQKCSKLGLE